MKLALPGRQLLSGVGTVSPGRQDSRRNAPALTPIALLPLAQKSLPAFTCFARRPTETSGSMATRSPSSPTMACSCSTPTARRRPRPRSSQKSGSSPHNRSATSSSRTGTGITGTARRSTPRVSGREGRRSRENADDDGGTGDRVQSAWAGVAAARLSRNGSSNVWRRRKRLRRRRPIAALKKALADGRFFLEQKSRCSIRCRLTYPADAAPWRPRDPGAPPRSRGHAR